MRSLASGAKKRARSLPRQALNSVHGAGDIAISPPGSAIERTLLTAPAHGKTKFSSVEVRISLGILVSATLLNVATVLLVSDLPALRTDLRTMLEGPDLTVEEAESGREALARVKDGGVDLVVVDLQVGSMGGMAIALDLRNEESYGAAEPVAILMLLDRRADVFLARRSGVEGFVVKPLDAQRVRAAVRALLRGDEYEDDSWRPTTVRVTTSK